MQVFIMRHGDAALDAASDSVRPLTSCGCDESRLMANWLKGQKVDIERVLVSPFLRAEQTLDVVGECMNLPTGVDVLPEYRRQGIASALTSRLTKEIINRGKVPFYCTAWSNVRSVRNAVKSGFIPAWVEMTAKPANIVDEMNL